MKNLYPFLFFAAISTVFAVPLLANFGNWGLYDWDQHLFYHESPRTSMLNYGQFPLWNAHYCGGTPLLANPQSPFLSPFFLLVLLFGAVAGLKLQILFYLLLGLFGTFLAARELKAAPIPASLAAVIFMLSSWFALRVRVGHTTFFPFALLPLAFYLYLKSLQKPRWLAAAALTLAIMFLSGGIYPFYASLLLIGGYSLLESIGTRKLKPILLAIAIFLLAFLLSAVKLLPMLELTSGLPVQKDTQLTSASIFLKALFSPFQNIEQKDIESGRDSVPEGAQKELATLEGKMPWMWHEYSAYMGVIAAILAALSALSYRRNWKLLLLAMFFFMLSLGDHSPVPVWKLLGTVPFFSSMHGPSRFIIPFVFMIALLAASALTSLKLPKKKTVSLAMLAIVTSELLLVSIPLLSGTFSVEPPKNLQAGSNDFIQLYTSAPYVSQYPNLLQNLGTLNCYERLHIKTRAVPQFVDGEPYPLFIANAYVAETNQSLNLSYFSPNKIAVSLDNAEINSTATLVINQNYYNGWKASNKREKSYKGLLAAEVTPDDKAVEFSYGPRSFAIGAVVSAAALLLSLLILFKPEIFKKLLVQPQS